MIAIDFFADAQAYIDNQSNEKPQKAPKPQPIKEDVATEPTELFSPALARAKDYSISEDNKTLTLKGVVYEIPSFYNKKMIAQRDKKTLEMVFISLGLNNLQV